uniref:CSON003239 protein n=1 Tax=Culicoides sonorensis TaxID=179676 RepID=A0A336K7K7_CULSO
MADENDNSCDKYDEVKPDKMFTLKKWNSVAMWSWDVECDTCAICRVQVMDRWVISARHCFGNKDKKFFITIGSVEQIIKTMKSWQKIAIREILFYEGDETSTKLHDIALVKTQKRIPIDGKLVSPVELPFRDKFYGGTVARLSAFGTKINPVNETSTIQTNTLEFMDARVMHNIESRCEGLQQWLCVKGISENATTCVGDSGSPLVLRGTNMIIGVVKGGFGGCGEPNKTSTFSRITFYADWIEEQTGLKFKDKEERNQRKIFGEDFSKSFSF